jgi:predicted PurR-regulated permease PerM
VISGAILATLAFIGLTVIGVEFALPLAVIVFFGELIPIVGPVIAYREVLDWYRPEVEGTRLG